MEKPINQIYETLQKLIGLHRQLLDVVRIEREALVQADLKKVQETTFSKQALIESIRHAETERMKWTSELAALWKKPLSALTLPQLIIAIQGIDPKRADQLRGTFNALTHLIQRITEQNQDNLALVERSLSHVNEMKKNVLGESVPKATTYTPNGQRSNGASGARLISKEA